jgi:cytosine/adenosine deaminase-related metal-dependent hydrolase
MNILIKNCNLISMEESFPECMPNMDIYIENGEIKEIGKSLSIIDASLKIIDASNKVVMPGLINTHSHIRYEHI